MTTGAATSPGQVPDRATGFAGLAWTDVRTRAQAVPGLGREVLLHAGPPLREGVPKPIWNAACQAVVYEGLAADARAAGEAIRQGRVVLRPAQDHGLATPLAQVVSASMPVAIVGDGQASACAPLVEGPAPALRFGQALEHAAASLRQLADTAFQAIAPHLRRHPVALEDIVREALQRGDECHARTGAANEALMRQLGPVAAPLRPFHPGFVLPILMAGALLRLRRQPQGVASVGGNGRDFGLRLHGETAWRTAPAEAPAGTWLSPPAPDVTVLGAIGDSAVLDFCGLGAQAIGACPDLLAEWRHRLAPDAVRAREALLHPTRGTVDPARVVATGVWPSVHLAMIDASGEQGLLGRGTYEVPPTLFRALAH